MGANGRGLALLHFEPRYQHAGHYLLYAKRDVDRYACDVARGAVIAPHELVEAAQTVGLVTITVARVWHGYDRDDRSALRAAGGLSRHCPTCRAAGTYHR